MLNATDEALAGKLVPAGGTLPSGVTLTVDLWAGTSASSLQVVATTDFGSGIGGIFEPTLVKLPTGMPGNAEYYFQVSVYSSDWSGGMSYWGESEVFTSYASAGVSYFSLDNQGTPSYSTWAAGTHEADDYGVAGAEGSIELRAVPEPSMLGFAALVIALIATQSSGSANRAVPCARAVGPAQARVRAGT